MLDSLLTKLRGVIESVAPTAETLAQREAVAVPRACCSLLMEVARLNGQGAERKRETVAQAMRAQFGISNAELAPMIADAGRPENRLTSYYKPVVLINRRCGSDEKAQFIEWLWRVAMADGDIDMYEEQLVRKLADLLYVRHSDFILAKHRVQNGGMGEGVADAPTR